MDWRRCLYIVLVMCWHLIWYCVVFALCLILIIIVYALAVVPMWMALAVILAKKTWTWLPECRTRRYIEQQPEKVSNTDLLMTGVPVAINFNGEALRPTNRSLVNSNELNERSVELRELVVNEHAI
jgi:hypothetical protein